MGGDDTSAGPGPPREGVATRHPSSIVQTPEITAPSRPEVELPGEFQPGTLRRRLVQAVLALAVLGAILALAPGLGEVRDRLEHANAWWMALAVGFEALSFASYVVMFGPVFCAGLPWRRSFQIGGSELAMGSLVPASGAGGLALGAWVLHRGGMPAARIARRSVAFFLIKSGVNFVAVALLGTAMALGLGPEQSLWLTALPAGMAVLAIAAVAAIPRLGPGRELPQDASRSRRLLSATRTAVTNGAREAGHILRRRDALVIGGALGYWAFDNAVLWATFHAVGFSPPLTVVLMGYLIGQLGGLLPIPGGIGGIDGGLIGTFIVFGAPAAATAAAVVGYRVILFWLPLIVGGAAFAALRRDMPSRGELASCAPAIAAQSG